MVINWLCGKKIIDWLQNLTAGRYLSQFIFGECCLN